MLLNKREAWKRENEEQLEEVAFGKDMRNIAKRKFEKLTEGDKRKPIDETGTRMKRENVVNESSAISGADLSDNSLRTTARSGKIGRSGKSAKAKNDNDDNGARNEDKLELLERTINVFGDNGSKVATDTASTNVAKVNAEEEKLAVSAGANNEVNGKLCAVNRETKIDKANGSCFANLTSDAKAPRVSEERQKVSGADDNAVKLNRATSYHRCEITDPEVELKNLEREGRVVHGVADREMTDTMTFHDGDGNRARNKLREEYPTELDETGEPGDPDPENNSELPRLRSNKWPKHDVVEWRLVPVIRTPPYHDDGRALSRIHLIGREIPPLNHIMRNVEIRPTAHLNKPKLWRAKRHRWRNGAFNILPALLRIVDDVGDVDSPRHGTRSKRVTEIADLGDFHADSKILRSKARKLSRLRGNKRRNVSIAEFAPRDRNRKLREITVNYPEFDDRTIHNVGVADVRLPYYGEFANTPVLHVATNTFERDGYVYRYPASYLEYGPFRERTRDSERRLARLPKIRLEAEIVDFPGNDLANNGSSKSGFARREKLSRGNGRADRRSRVAWIISRPMRQGTRESLGKVT